MASKSGTTSVDSELSTKLDMIISSMSDLKKNQESMKKMFESKIDKLKQDLMSNIDSKIKTLRNEISLDLGKEASRIDVILNSIQSIQGRLGNVEHFVTNGPHDDNRDHDTGNTHDNGTQRDPLNNNDVTIIATNLPTVENEDIMETARTVILALGDTAEAQKIEVLRNKFKLRNR